MAGAATDARKTAGSARHAARSRKLPAGATTDARHAALATWTAAGTIHLATRAAVTVGIATAAARVLLEDNVRCCAASRRASRESFSCRHRRNSNRRSNSSTNYQRFHQIQFR